MLSFKLGLAMLWIARPVMVDLTAYALWGVLMVLLVGYVAWIIHTKSKKN